MTQQISQKDLMYVTDHMAIEQEQIKKFSDASREATDPQCKKMFQDIANMHQQHFDALKKHIGGGRMM